MGNSKNNVVPDIERAEIVAEAKKAAITEVVKRSVSINQLPVTTDINGKKIELSSGESTEIETIISQAVENSGPTWEDE